MKHPHLQNRATQRTSEAAGRLRERILSLLLESKGPRTAYDLAKAAGATLAYGYAYVGKLEAEGFLEGTKVVRPAELIDYWQSIREKPRVIEFFVPNPVGLLVPTPKAPYASTTYLAESRLHHYLMPVRWDLYVREVDVEDWMTACKHLGGLRGPGNLRLLVGDPWIPENPFETRHGFAPSTGTDPLKWVGDPRLVLDLRTEGALCVEAAELIMKSRGWTRRTRMRKRS